jgi:hypothetical protein
MGHVFWLFGARLTFDNKNLSYTSIQGSDGKIYTCSVIGEITSEINRRVAFSIEGLLPHCHIKLTAEFAYRIEAGEMLLESVVSIDADSKIILLLNSNDPLKANPSIENVELLMPSTPEEAKLGFGILESENTLQAWIELVNDGVKKIMQVSSWNDSHYWIDTRTDSIDIMPDAGLIELVDSLYSDQFDEEIKRTQEAPVVSMHIDINGLHILAKPESGALMLHPDVFDTRSVSTDEDNEPVKNEILYQYALVNGVIEWTVLKGKNSQIQIRWIASLENNAPSPGMVVFRYQDEHGNPLVLKPIPIDGSKPNFRLGYREGIAESVAENDFDGYWSRTNRGVVVIGYATEDGINNEAIPCILSALDPIKIYGRSPGDDPFTEPRWLVDGKAYYATKAPLEIHGMITGARLRCRKEVIQKLWDQETMGHKATLKFVEVIDPDTNDIIFHQSELVLNHAAHWDLDSQTQERYIYPDISNKQTSTISGRRAEAKEDASQVVLPLIDTKFAFANLSGVDRRNAETQMGMGNGQLAELGRKWAETLNNQFAGNNSSVYKLPEIDIYTHVDGFGAFPSKNQPFETVIETPPVTARKIEVTGTKAIGLIASDIDLPEIPLEGMAEVNKDFRKTFPTDLMFGGERSIDSFKKLGEKLDKASDGLGKLKKQFFDYWNDPKALSLEAQEGLVALKKLLVGVRQFLNTPTGVEDEIAAEVFYSKKLSQIIEKLSSGKAVPGIPLEENTEFLDLFLHMTPVEFGEYWRTKPEDEGDDFFLGLWDFFWAPPTNELFRRTLRLLFPNLRARGAGLEIDATIKEYKDVLVNELIPFNLDWTHLMKSSLEGFLADLEEGADALYRAAVAEWKNGVDDQLDLLRAEFGPHLTEDVYQSILEDKEAAENFLAILKEKNAIIKKYADQLEELADLNSSVGDYVFFTQKFETKQISKAKRLLQSQSVQFDLCQLGSDTNWSLFLDDETTAIIKKTRDRSFADILREIEKEYQTSTRHNPLGVDLVAPLLDGQTPVDILIDRLHPELQKVDWVGVLLISPNADISDDKALRDLAGLETLKVAYAGIGGRKPRWKNTTAEKSPSISVCANIFREEPAPKNGNTMSGNWNGDTKLALIKVDITIFDTKIEKGEIIFRMDLQNMLGQDWNEDNNPGLEKPKLLYIRGVLPEETGKDANGAPRSLEFGAWFDEHYKAQVDISFLKRVELKSVQVGQYMGRTAINLDGALVLQNTNVAGVDLEFPEESGSTEPIKEMAINLSNFRILLPGHEGGKKRDFGTFVPLNFNFPSVSFALPKPRAFNLWGIEFLPTTLGLIRNVSDELTSLEARFTWLKKLKFTPGNKVIPFIELSVDFGKLPEFGSGGLNGLKFKMALVVDWNIDSGAVENVALGISGVSAKEIHIDLFRLLSLTLRDFKLGRFYSRSDPDDSQSELKPVTGLVVGDLDFKILDWEPLGEKNELSLMFLQPNDKKNQNKGMLAYYGLTDQNEVKDDFFRLYWLLLGHNLNVKKEILHHLLFDKHVSGQREILNKLVGETQHKGEDVIDAAVTSKEEWLMGMSFGLGDILDECSFVFHDNRYYGIRLSAFWVEPIFQQRSIELAYIPGSAPNSDRYRTNLRLPFMDLLGVMRSGEFALEWSPKWDFLIDIGFPWNMKNGPNWFRTFAAGQGVECKIGWFLDKKTALVPTRTGSKGTSLTISAGFGYYLGYYYGTGDSVAYLRAGIGVFAILQGSVTFMNAAGSNPFKGSIVALEVRGTIGIFAYCEGGINIWVLSASFRVAVVAAITTTLIYIKNAPCKLTYNAEMHAYYAASCRVGAGPFKWTFRVSGRIGIGVTGQLLLN